MNWDHNNPTPPLILEHQTNINLIIPLVCLDSKLLAGAKAQVDLIRYETRHWIKRSEDHPKTEISHARVELRVLATNHVFCKAHYRQLYIDSFICDTWVINTTNPLMIQQIGWGIPAYTNLCVRIYIFVSFRLYINRDGELKKIERERSCRFFVGIQQRNCGMGWSGSARRRRGRWWLLGGVGGGSLGCLIKTGLWE